MIKGTVPVMYADLTAREIISIVERLKSHNVCTEYTWDSKLQSNLLYTEYPCLYRNKDSIYIQSHIKDEECSYFRHQWKTNQPSIVIIKIKNNVTEIFERSDSQSLFGINEKFIEIQDRYMKKFLKIHRKDKIEIFQVQEIFLSNNQKTAIKIYLQGKSYKNTAFIKVSEVTDKLLKCM